MFEHIILIALAVGGPKRKKEETFEDKITRLIEVEKRLSEIGNCFPDRTEIQHFHSIAHRQGDK
jgi:hypothetical protein